MSYGAASQTVSLSKHGQEQMRVWKAWENEGNSPWTHVLGIKSGGRGKRL
jgi:hypothetical protein